MRIQTPMKEEFKIVGFRPGAQEVFARKVDTHEYGWRNLDDLLTEREDAPRLSELLKEVNA